MEPPGVLPPDRDKEKYLTQSNVNISISTSTINQITTSTSSIGGVSTSSQQTLERLSRPMAFDKMESLVKEMQDSETGVPVRSQKLFLTSIPSAFMGYDLIEWLMERLSIEESEALNIANQLCLHGYFFPVNDSKTLVVKDDSSLYRFQTPYYWPWQHKAPDNVEYAIYLAKRSLRNKQRHGLEEYETEALANLHKNLKGKWDFITMQAEEQVKLAKERKKGDKIVGDSQERAYWRVHRPPPGQFTPLEPCPVPSRDRQGKPRRRTIDDWQREVDILTASLGRTRMKMSQACECLVSYCETFAEYDPMIQQPLPSNPWVSEDITFWQLNSPIVDIPTEKRVRRWAISIEEIVSDPTGLQEFTSYLKKEYSHENIRFWLAVNDLRRSSHSLIPKKVKEIYEEFLAPGAPCEINIDGKTMENVQLGLKSPSRFAFDSAAEHIYALLLKKDCYPRFIRSEHYKLLLASGIQPSHKKRFFGFGGVAKKKSTTTAPNPALLAQATGQASTTGQGLTRRRGSDRSLSGSAHELAVSGVKDSSKVPHSHSQSNLSDIPYRGDMPCGSLPITMEICPNLNSSTTTGGPLDANSNIQEGVKSFSENLETTVESGGASAVCPWDSNEPTTSNVPTTVSVSVCPWEGDCLIGPGNAAKSIASLPSSSIASSDLKFKSSNLGIEGLGNISSEISEVSERMKRSCGLRQNTLDCDFHSTKRLMTTINEQRRASVTVAPRVSDLQYNPRRMEQHHPIDLTSPFLTASISGPKQSISQYSLTLSKTKSFEEKDLGNLLTQPIVISEEDINLQQQRKNDDKINDNENKINTDNNDSLKTLNNSNDNILVLSSNDNIIFNRSDINTCSVVPPAGAGGANNVGVVGEAEINLDVSSSITILSRNSPPIINVVTCPTIELDSREVDNENDEENPVDPQLDEDVSITDNTCITAAPSNRNDDIQVTIEPPTAFTSPDHQYKEHKLSTEQTKYSIEEEVTMHEDLSPTTEEYQECMSFQNRADQGDTDEFDLASGCGNLAPGCVAPAPTPAPSIAPLAEVEIDPPDDDGDGDGGEAKGLAEVKEEDQKKKRKKRSSTDKIDNQDKASSSTSDDPNKNNEQQKRYAVCPWEDEDVTASVDQTFVKTYSTLGYL